jgi:hypothetical protein
MEFKGLNARKELNGKIGLYLLSLDNLFNPGHN